METIYFKRNQFEADKSRLFEAKEAFQALFDSVNETGALTVNSIEQLKTIAQKGEDGYKDLLEKAMEPPKIAGIPLKKRKAIEIMDLPDLSAMNERAYEARYLINMSEYLEINGSTIEISHGAVKDLERLNSILADTQEAKKLFEAHKAAQKALKDLQEASEKIGQPFPVYEGAKGLKEHLFKLFTIEEGKISIKPDVYREMKNKYPN